MKVKHLRIKESGYKNPILYGIELTAVKNEDIELIQKFKKGFKIIDSEKSDKIKIFVKDIIE